MSDVAVSAARKTSDPAVWTASVSSSTDSSL